MEILNIEIKAKYPDLEKARKTLKEKDARFVGLDHQVDTYFKVSRGRLKIREGNIENAILFYQRTDMEGPKQSDIVRSDILPDSDLKKVLTNSLGVLAIVDKKREIYFIDNVKIHLDQLEVIGTFMEIEAIGKHGVDSAESLQKQCEEFMTLFGVEEANLCQNSYSDMVLEK